MRVRALPASATALPLSPAEKKTASPALHPADLGDEPLHLVGDELRDRALADERSVDLLEHHVAEPRRALRARPVVELVEERARLRGRAGRGDRADHAAVLHARS